MNITWRLLGSARGLWQWRFDRCYYWNLPKSFLSRAGTCTGDETWFEAVSLRPPLSLLGEPPVLSSHMRRSAKPRPKLFAGPLTRHFSNLMNSRWVRTAGIICNYLGRD